MSTRGATVRTARWPDSRRVEAGVAVITVAMLELLCRSALDRNLFRFRFGRAGELYLEDAPGVAGLRPVWVEVLSEPDRPGEGAQWSLAPVITLLGNVGLGLALAANRHAVAHDRDLQARPVHAG